MAKPAEQCPKRLPESFLPHRPNPLVVHVYKQPFDVYIGRQWGKFPTSKWGNPFHLARNGNDRELVLFKFNQWVWEPAQKDLRNQARVELKGKILGCYCSPEMCHGDIWCYIANQTEMEL